MLNYKAIGGYYEFALPQYGSVYHDAAYRFQSARAAFRALLQTIKPTKLWVPKYTCDAVIEPLETEGVDYVWYNLDLKLAINDKITLEEGEYIFYINYFGLCDNNIENLLTSFPPEKIILDCSQGFFSKKRGNVLATIYSPRKFLAVPDGGMLETKLNIHMPERHDELSIDRMKYSLKRMSSSPEDGYSDYLRAESSLGDSTPLRMSKLTERLLQSVDFERVKDIRRENYNFLKLALADLNGFDPSSEGVALCYPFVTNNDKLKELLIKNRIFIPTYWRDSLARVNRYWAKKMIHNLLPIPIDQRYDISDMKIIVDLILESLGE